MTITQQIITVGVVVIGTMLTRFYPFSFSQLINRLPSTSNILAKCYLLPLSVCSLFIALKMSAFFLIVMDYLKF